MPMVAIVAVVSVAILGVAAFAMVRPSSQDGRGRVVSATSRAGGRLGASPPPGASRSRWPWRWWASSVAMQWNSSLARDQFTTSAQQVLAAQVTDLEAEQDMPRQEIATANAQVLRLGGVDG